MDTLRDIFPDLNAEDVLQSLLGVGEIYEEGSELRHSCILPFGLHNNGDSNPSASLNRDSLLYNCFVCGGGSIIWLIQNCLDLTRDQAIKELKNYSATLSVISVEKFTEKLNQLFDSSTTQKLDIPTYNEKILSLWTKVNPYLVARGVSVEVQEEMKTGIKYSTEKGMIVERAVIPHFIDNKLVGWVARKTSESKMDGLAKYKNSRGFPRKYSLFNLDKIKDFRHCYVVESPMSVLVLKSRGNRDVVATFGASVSKPQVELLRCFDSLTIFMDGDSAGRNSTKELVSALKEYSRVRVVDPPEGKDPVDLIEIPEVRSSFEYEINRKILI